MARVSHKKRVLRHLVRYGSITQREANRISVGRLSARILELRKEGNEIKTTWVNGKNQYGEPIRYGKYILEVKEGA